MLTEEEKIEISKEINVFPFPQAACLDALKIVQNKRRWVSDEAIRDIADFLSMSSDEVDGVATFYSRIYRQPVGRNIILVCNSMTCLLLDYDTVYDSIVKKLKIRFGETTPDNRYTLLPVSCLGDCDHAPAIMINEDLYSDVSVDNIEEILKKYL
ncbi:MAG: NADH-quinone oxidoreductase subunit NuoE [Syntrophothermus sp.]